jgi:hypothetical protein
MPSYRCYYLNSNDDVAATDLIECDSDARAQARASVLLAASDHHGIEVWDCGRRVHYAQKPDSSEGALQNRARG